MLKVPTERVVLLLVRGSNRASVGVLRWLEHSLERQLADRLTVLDHEWHIMRADFQRSPRSMKQSIDIESEARVEEALCNEFSAHRS